MDLGQAHPLGPLGWSDLLVCYTAPLPSSQTRGCREEEPPRAGWGRLGVSKPSLCFPPFPSSCLPACPLPALGAAWSTAAMDRYSMEELIQLGQGGQGLAGTAGIWEGGAKASSGGWAGLSRQLVAEALGGLDIRAAWACVVWDGDIWMQQALSQVSIGQRGPVHYPAWALLPPGASPLLAVESWALLRLPPAQPSPRAGCCRPVSFRNDFLKPGWQAGGVGGPRVPSPAAAGLPVWMWGAPTPAVRGQVCFAVHCVWLTTHARDHLGSVTTSCNSRRACHVSVPQFLHMHNVITAEDLLHSVS